MSFKKRLKMARINKDLKQNEAAKLLDITNSTLSTYERGIAEPDIETLKKIAELYEISLDYLVGIDSDKIEGHFSHPLDNTFHEALTEMNTTDIHILSNEDIDEETARAVKIALKNGIRMADEMLKNEDN